MSRFFPFVILERAVGEVIEFHEKQMYRIEPTQEDRKDEIAVGCVIPSECMRVECISKNNTLTVE